MRKFIARFRARFALPKSQRRTSLKLRLVILSVGLFVAFIWTLAFVSAHVMNARLEQLLADQQLTAATHLTYLVDQKLKENIDGLERAAAGLPTPLMPATLQPLLAQRPLMHVAFSGGLLVLDLEGKVIADYPARGRPGSYYDESDWFRAVLASGKPYVAKPVSDPVLARPVLTLAAPILDGGGQVRGVLSGSIDLAAQNFLAFVADPALTGNSEFYVVSVRDGLFVAATDPRRALTVTPPRGRNAFYDRMQDGYEGSAVATSSEGISKLYSGKRVPSADWLVMAALPVDIAFGPVRAMQRYLYAAALLLTVVAALVLGLMLRRMLAPLEEAAQAIGAMTNRQRDMAPLPVRRNDEIGALVRNFNCLVADRLEYEAALTESEQRFRRLVEGAPDAIFVQTQGRFAYVNAAALALFGASTAAELLGQPIIERIHPDDRGRVAERIRRVNEEHLNNPALEQTYLRRDGTAVQVEVSAVPFLFGDDHGAIVFARDIGEKKRAATELERYRLHLEAQVETRTAQLAEAKQAAEAAARAKSDFLATMSHEIRTPLGIIIGLGSILRARLREPAQRKRLEQLCGTADHLLALVNDILDLSKIDAGHLALEESDFRLAAVLDKVANLIGELVREKGLELEVAVAPTLRTTLLRGDALRLAQVLINLAGNAVKFTERGSVCLEVTTVAETVETLCLRFAVRDTGIGIAPADQERVFRLFEQAEASATSNHGGTGLGLAISRKFVALMGGSLCLDSVPGVGSIFHFELTLPRGRAPAELADAMTLPTFAGARILVVDDHPVNQEIIMELLETLGCETEIAGDGAEAKMCAQAAAYDAILMDVRMPRMDGFAATRAIRAMPGHRDTPILAVTANAFGEDRQSCLDAGMNGYISKPFTLNTLASALRQWLPHRVVAHEVPPADAALSHLLDEIPGLDPDCLPRRTAPRLASYALMLRSYVDMHEHDMKLLHAHLAAGDEGAARGSVHQLKGVSGFVGAKRVAALATEIDAALRAGADADSVAPLAASCADELARLAAAIRTMPEIRVD